MSRVEGPILSEKLGEDQKKRSSRIKGPILSQKLGVYQKKSRHCTNSLLLALPQAPWPTPSCLCLCVNDVPPKKVIAFQSAIFAAFQTISK